MAPGTRTATLSRRIAALDAVSRRRPLTAAETDELAALVRDRVLRARRLPGQIAAAEAKLFRLRAEAALLA